jgi:signal transduction histidine kinase
MQMTRAWLRRLTSPRDVGLVLCLVTAAVVEIASAPASSPITRSAYAVAAIGGLLVRRTFPLFAVGIVSIAVVLESLLLESPEEVGVLLAVIVSAFSLAAYAPSRDTVIGTAVVSMAVAVAVATDPSDSVSNILPTLLLFVGLPVGLGLTVHRRQRDLAALQLAAVASADEAAEAVEAERRRIARELHDVVSHAVTLVAVQAEAGQSVIARDPAAAGRSLAAIADASRDALIELDRMLHVLRDADGTRVETEAGLERVPALVEGARSAGLSVEVVREGDPVPLAAGAEACAFRVVQEGLTNALRHAPSSTVLIRLEHSPAGLGIAVETTGRRRASSYGGGGRGLAGLRERVVSLGGSLETAAAQNGDFTLRVSLPGARP